MNGVPGKIGRPKSKNPRIVQIGVRIKPDAKKQFYSKCKENGVSPTKLIRTWIVEYLGSDTKKK